MNLFDFSVEALSLGCLYALSSMGFVILFRTGRVINLAHGELMGVGAFIFIFLHRMMDLPMSFAFPLTVLAGAVLALVIGLLFTRTLDSGNIIQGMITTIGIALILRGALSFLGSNGDMEGSHHSTNYPVILSVEIISIALFLWFLKRSSAGLKIRALSDNRMAAFSLGVSIKNLSALVWAIAGTAAFIGGILLSMINGLDINSLGSIELKIFPVIILGGLGSIRGVLIGGLIIGFLDAFAAGYVSDSLRDVIPYLIILFVLFLRPYGLFQYKGRQPNIL